MGDNQRRQGLSLSLSLEATILFFDILPPSTSLSASHPLIRYAASYVAVSTRYDKHTVRPRVHVSRQEWRLHIARRPQTANIP